MEKVNWADRVRNEEVLFTVQEKRNIVQTVNSRKANWIGYSWRRNCLLKHVIEGMIKEVKGRRGRRRTQLVDDLKESRHTVN